MSGTEVEAGDAGRGESGYTKKVNSSTPSQNDSWAVWASQIDYSRQWKRIPGAFLTPLNSLFFSTEISSGLLQMVELGAVMASSADVSLHGAGGGGISLDLITSWLDQLSTGPLYKRSHWLQRYLTPLSWNSSFCLQANSGKRIPPNVDIKLDFPAR